MIERICLKTDYVPYIVENMAVDILESNKNIHERIKELFGEKYIIDDTINQELFDIFEIEEHYENFLKLQDYVKDEIVDNINMNKEDKLIIASNEIVQLDMLRMSPNLISIEFFKSTLEGDDISLESMKEISTHIIEPKDLDEMEMELRGCLTEILGY